MKEYLEKALVWLRSYRAKEKREDYVRRYNSLMAEARNLIQVREWDGTVWVCVGNVPMLEKDDLAQNFTSTVDNMRGIYVAYHMGGQVEFGKLVKDPDDEH